MTPANSIANDTTNYDETSPLLRTTSNAHNAEAQIAEKPKSTPLPKGQLTALCIVRLVEPITFTQLFPYVNEFMSDLHLTDDPSKIGFYSGLVESAFAVSQLCSIYHWARLSDVIGRRPVIFLGIIGLAITTLMFGLSKSLASVLVARCLGGEHSIPAPKLISNSVGGLFSGNIAVIHSVLGEITDSTNQMVAFPIYGLAWPIGSIIGPLMGGAFSHPALKYPEILGYQFLKDYPYFLPCFIASTFAIIGVSLGFIFLEETLPSKRNGKKSISPNASTNGDSVTTAPALPEKPLSVSKLLSVPIISALALSGFMLSYIGTSFDVVFVLFCYSPIKSGGLAFSASQIGYSLAIAGAIGAAIQLCIMSYLLRTFDPAKIYCFCMSLWPYTFLVLPVLNLIARAGLDETTGELGTTAVAFLWVGIAFVLLLTKAACIAYGVSMILTKENAPNAASLGQSNGLVQFTMCFARSFAPFVVSALFATSLEYNLLGGYLWLVIMVMVSFLGMTTSRKIKQSSVKTIG
ncbi:major facilitator superfamily domain-containing protein [Suillus discolor]|uniref:Major facilitator superfamily domain-containing protein n=1 Tax=Suillus discolor TaxID=1912936 RepID=A0A9P7JYD9_9AGAM|nr:major facilitator superfamily domain-containing protein [Suillus discolor]KAG2115131.1 major facilitator superfamily domain-containing protein [Suillus discolor]